MSAELDTELQLMWKRIYAQCQTIAQQEVLRLFGSNVRGGALNPGAIQPGSSGQVLTTTSGGQTAWAAPLSTSLELTDGTHDLTAVTKITVSGAVVGGTSASATLTISGGADATTTTTGVVEIDQAPGSGHPIALTLPRFVQPNGVASLGGDGLLPSFELPAITGSITEASIWSAATATAIITPTQSWESTIVAEPVVLFHDGLYKMWFSGTPGTQAQSATGYATCPGASDPTVAANWTQYAGNPVVAATSLEPFVLLLPDGTFRMYHSDGANLNVASSSDGITWTSLGVAIATGTAGQAWWARSTVWLEGSTWHGLFEGGGSSGPWAIYHGTSTTGIAFTLDGYGALTTLSVGGTYGGPYTPVPPMHDGLYHLWYHASTSGTSPAAIYHATSPDLHTWTVVGGAPVLNPGNICNPSILEAHGSTTLFYFTQSPHQIIASKYSGTLAALVAGTQPPLINPMTTAGDLIIGGTSGAPTRLGIGATGTILTSTGTDPAWTANMGAPYGPLVDSGKTFLFDSRGQIVVGRYS